MLGDTYTNQNNNSQKGKYTPTVYSNYVMANSESTIDATKLVPTFCMRNMLKLEIQPRVQNNSEKVEYDENNGVAVYLSHTKARMLFEEICVFQQDPQNYSNVGVPSGAGIISISNGKEFGVNGMCIIVRRINAESGAIEASAAYEFKHDYHYAVRNFDTSTLDFDKIYYNSLEIEQFKTLLMTYYEAMSGATAYSVVYHMNYDMNRTNNKIDRIAEKLGVEYNGASKYTNKSSSSIFNNKEPRNFSSTTIDDIEKQLG